MHGKFYPRDRAAARTKFSYAWSVSNASKGGRGETLSVANGCSIIEETWGGVGEDASQGPLWVSSIMLKYSITQIRFSTPTSTLVHGV